MKDSWDGNMGKRENMGNIILNGNVYVWLRKRCSLTAWNEQGKEMRAKEGRLDRFPIEAIEARCICTN